MDVDAGLVGGWFVRFVERVVAFYDGRRASGRERPVRGRLSALAFWAAWYVESLFGSAC